MEFCQSISALYQAAAARGYALTAELVFVDDGYSGARLDRPGLEPQVRHLMPANG